MARDKGQPSATNKSEEGTGTPARVAQEDLRYDQNMTEKYTDDDENVADHVREMHPNRNTDKDNATNAGGYKS